MTAEHIDDLALNDFIRISALVPFVMEGAGYSISSCLDHLGEVQGAVAPYREKRK